MRHGTSPDSRKILRCFETAGWLIENGSSRTVEARKLRQVYDWVARFEKYWDEKLDGLGDYLDERERNRANS